MTTTNDGSDENEVKIYIFVLLQHKGGQKGTKIQPDVWMGMRMRSKIFFFTDVQNAEII